MARLGRNSLIKVFVIIFFLVYCRTLLVVSSWQAPRIVAVDSRNSILIELHTLVRQALHIANTSTGFSNISGHHGAARTELQIFLKCLVHLLAASGYDMETNDAFTLDSNLSNGTACNEIRSNLLADSWNTSVLCHHLIGMKILIVGSHTTYRLHNALLDILPSGSQGSQFRCHGPALCTWHEVCTHSFPQLHIPLSSERRRIPPHDLSNSAILRFAMSSTLLTNAPDEANHPPYVNPLTGVREHDTLDWFEKAGRSDMIILSKRPVPAPAWSYFSSEISSTHRFNVRIPRPGSPESRRMEPFTGLLMPHGLLRDSSVVQAAWKATIVKWLPELIETLIYLKTEKVAMKGRLLVWLGSSFVTDCTSEQEKQEKRTEIPWIQACAGCEDRCIFENTQVYIQNLLLHQLLPRLGVLYIPVANPSSSRPNTSSVVLSKSRRGASISMFDNTTERQSAEDVFLHGLVAILRWKQMGRADADDKV